MRSVSFYDYTIYEDGCIMGKYGKMVKPTNKSGRLEVGLYIGGKRKRYIVSRLVYYVFNDFDIDNKDLCVVSKDGDLLNTHLDNLELKHRKDIIQGEKHREVAKITDIQVSEIRKLYNGKAGANQHNKDKLSLNDIALRYGITKGNVASIVKGRSRNKDSYKLK